MRDTHKASQADLRGEFAPWLVKAPHASAYGATSACNRLQGEASRSRIRPHSGRPALGAPHARGACTRAARTRGAPALGRLTPGGHLHSGLLTLGAARTGELLTLTGRRTLTPARAGASPGERAQRRHRARPGEPMAPSRTLHPACGPPRCTSHPATRLATRPDGRSRRPASGSMTRNKLYLVNKERPTYSADISRPYL